MAYQAMGVVMMKAVLGRKASIALGLALNIAVTLENWIIVR